MQPRFVHNRDFWDSHKASSSLALSFSNFWQRPGATKQCSMTSVFGFIQIAASKTKRVLAVTNLFSLKWLVHNLCLVFDCAFWRRLKIEAAERDSTNLLSFQLAVAKNREKIKKTLAYLINLV